MESVSCATRRQRLANAHACECRSNRSVAPYPGAKCKRWWRSWYASEAEPPVVAGRLAIATAFSFGSGSAGEELSSCALVKWCYSATALAALPYVSAHVRVLTDNVALAQRECVAAQGAAASLHVQPFDPELVGVVKRWISVVGGRLARAGSYLCGAAPLLKCSGGQAEFHPFSFTAMLKWQVVGLTQYAAVLFLDADVDLYLHTAGAPSPLGSTLGEMHRYTWTRRLSQFVNEPQTQLLASADFHTPVNTGIMMLKPSRRTYALGRALLEGLSFDYRRGFNASGRPRDVLPLSLIARERVMPRYHLGLINRSAMLRHNTWRVVGGEGDQGLFAYVFLGLLPPGSMRPPSFEPFVAVHYAGGLKPWRRQTRCAQYFDFLANRDFEHAPTRCMQLLADRRACLSPKLNASQCDRCRHGWHPTLSERRVEKQKSSCEGTGCFRSVDVYRMVL